ncbi:MAG: hypothetical protein Q9165_003887 [Trypethelium subeluteriae]
MSLIPAKNYYATDNSDQWQRKKQTKEQKKAARKEKLKPENQKSAKDILDENERKRKRELGQEEEDEPLDLNKPSLEKPKEGMKPPKKRKVANNPDSRIGTEANGEDNGGNPGDNPKGTKAEKRKEKRKAKAEKVARQHEKAEAKKARKQEEQLAEVLKVHEDELDAGKVEETLADVGDADMEGVNIEGITEGIEHESHSSVTPTSAPETPQSPRPYSTSSSISSIIPPSTADLSEIPQPNEIPQSKVSSATKTSEPSAIASTSVPQSSGISDAPSEQSTVDKSKRKKLPSGSEINTELLRARLKTRIDALRAARKADGPDGQPARNRQELLDQRRRKEEERRQRKKELRKQQKEAEAAAEPSSQGKPSGAKQQAAGKEPETNFSYGNIRFDDGARLDPSLSTLLPNAAASKKKGPSDPKTALAAAQHKAARLAGLDAETRADIDEKDSWLNARKRVHGEKSRDDPKLLAKTVRRKEKGKAKSAKEWGEREEGIRKGKEARQRKREDNLRKRKEGKGVKGKGGVGKKKKKGGKRPGFEGRFKT